MPISLSIVIPAFNESVRLGVPLAEVLDYLNETAPRTSEVIVVDDGSTDDTARVAEAVFAQRARAVAVRVIRYEENCGKGYAVRAGFLAAKGAIVLFSDADLSTPITETPKLVAPIRNGRYDVVFGSRAVNRRLIGTHQPWHREYSGRLFNRVMRLATGMPFKDTQCGFKAFRMDVCRPLIEAARIDRFGFDVELLYLAYRAGLRMREQAVRWNDVAGSKVSFTRGLRAFDEVREIHRLAKRGVYDEAIERARAIARTKAARAPIFDDADKILSDVSAKLANARR
jgi:dolichyl-phosphate beta-glucosyltransferase